MNKNTVKYELYFCGWKKSKDISSWLMFIFENRKTRFNVKTVCIINYSLNTTHAHTKDGIRSDHVTFTVKVADPRIGRHSSYYFRALPKKSGTATRKCWQVKQYPKIPKTLKRNKVGNGGYYIKIKFTVNTFPLELL
jgi:hypothetical protein